MRLVWRALTVGALTVGSAAATAPTADADSSSWLSIPAGSPMFDLDALTPGDGGSAVFTVTNPQGSPVIFSIGVDSLVSDDNGCGEPEREAGDTTCGASGGELDGVLRLVLVTGDRPVRDSTLSVWSAASGSDPVPLNGHEVRSYSLSYQLPSGATNVVQSDLVSFAFRMSLDEPLGSVVGSESPPVIVVATPTLPTTGADLSDVIAVAMVASLLGISLHRISVRRRRSR